MAKSIHIIFPEPDTESSARPRLDAFLAGQPDMPTRSQIKHLIEEGQVVLNGKPAKAAALLKPGDVIEAELPDPAEYLKIGPEPIPLTILYEDEHLIVLDKPAGLIVHPTSTLKTGTLVNALLHHCQDLSGIGGEYKPGIVHRLDKLTSGVMVAAKSNPAHLGLAEQFRAHSVNRRYLALVHGAMTKASGTFTSLIARHPTRRKKMSGKVSRGKTAVTHYTVKAHYDYFTLIECRLQTGRTHQIRVHLSENNHPVVGDPMYGQGRALPGKVSPVLRSALRSLKRQALHAYLLGLVHPITKKYMEFTSDIPPDIRAVLRALEQNKNDL